jgi:hypothetical protein
MAFGGSLFQMPTSIPGQPLNPADPTTTAHFIDLANRINQGILLPAGAPRIPPLDPNQQFDKTVIDTFVFSINSTLASLPPDQSTPPIVLGLPVPQASVDAYVNYINKTMQQQLQAMNNRPGGKVFKFPKSQPHQASSQPSAPPAPGDPFYEPPPPTTSYGGQTQANLPTGPSYPTSYGNSYGSVSDVLTCWYSVCLYHMCTAFPFPCRRKVLLAAICCSHA